MEGPDGMDVTFNAASPRPIDGLRAARPYTCIEPPLPASGLSRLLPPSRWSRAVQFHVFLAKAIASRAMTQRGAAGTRRRRTAVPSSTAHTRVPTHSSFCPLHMPASIRACPPVARTSRHQFAARFSSKSPGVGLGRFRAALRTRASAWEVPSPSDRTDHSGYKRTMATLGALKRHKVTVVGSGNWYAFRRLAPPFDLPLTSPR